MRKLKFITFFIILIVVLLFLSYEDASAVPSFARQIGMPCAACHTVFPELTPFGREFKLTGYTLSRPEEKREFPFLPLSVQFQTSYTRTNKSIPGEAGEGEFSKSKRILFPDEASIYFGGKIISHLGALVQGTYSRVDNNIFLDMTDIRFANTTTLFDKRLVYGITLNNAPALQDVWNSTPPFGFPFASSGVAPTPAAAALIDGGLDQQVGGIGVYGYWNNLIYGELSVYRTTDHGVTKPLGAGTDITTIVKGAAPYWRFAVQRQWAEHSLEIGTFGIFAKVFPGGGDPIRGPTDEFTDIAFDTQYQYIGDPHVISFQALYIHEKQDWKASFPLGITANRSDNLNTFRATINYRYKRLIGGSLQYFSTTGDSDSVLYGPEEVVGSRTGSPNSNGFITELDYFPWQNTRFSIQYTVYNKFNGAKDDYDGFGRRASDNNTLFVLLWVLF